MASWLSWWKCLSHSYSVVVSACYWIEICLVLSSRFGGVRPCAHVCVYFESAGVLHACEQCASADEQYAARTPAWATNAHSNKDVRASYRREAESRLQTAQCRHHGHGRHPASPHRARADEREGWLTQGPDARARPRGEIAPANRARPGSHRWGVTFDSWRTSQGYLYCIDGQYRTATKSANEIERDTGT